MFSGNIKLFEVFGFAVRVNVSWAFIALLIAWSLAQGYFPAVYKGFPETTYWWMGVAGVLGLFLSIVLHELAHSLVGRAYGIQIKGITLWLLGGVAELGDEPPSARAEFLMSIAGPLVSVLLAIGFWLGAGVTERLGASEAAAGVFSYLGLLNIVLAVFNMIPAFPLDGGRVLRAGLWAWSDDRRWATRLASRIGQWFGVGLMALGVFQLLSQPGLTGLWWIIMGMFIRSAASNSYYQFEASQLLKGKSISRFMSPDPITVAPDITVQTLIDEWVHGHFHEFFPVVERAKVVGAVGMQQIKQVPRETWRTTTVRQIMAPPSAENSVGADREAKEVLELMHNTGNSRLMVMDNDALAGVVALKDLLKPISLKMELE
jgi:Zn-dependent protease/CBS domain-containing protein